MYIVRHYYRGMTEYHRLQMAVRIHYLKHYGATPDPNPDFFVCLTGSDGNVPGYACVGITFGDSGKLFSEYYLNDTLDHTYDVERVKIVELSSLASFCSGNGAGKYLLNTVIKTLTLHNYRIAVLTATEQVRMILHTLVDSFDDLGEAEPTRVKDPKINWGTYYSHSPRVIVFPLAPRAAWVPNSDCATRKHAPAQPLSYPLHHGRTTNTFGNVR
ncbi:thermostable hemolysin [Samsonia erythrinae]|uniref:Thermostable hemolysin n=1 Tax=Samsonia erythrinae TaxID=160434 RepID=A0A4R3VIG1_9GAMM|nr:thermostable hemolysin [Samsonia erythrinae]TCV05444.1 thermostable hemolysin [Samsonia erythrinae]